MRIDSVSVTKSATAYQDLSQDQCVNIDISAVENVIPVEPDFGIGRSVIFFRNGSSMNVPESVEELYDLGLGA